MTKTQKISGAPLVREILSKTTVSKREIRQFYNSKCEKNPGAPPARRHFDSPKFVETIIAGHNPTRSRKSETKGGLLLSLKIVVYYYFDLS